MTPFSRSPSVDQKVNRGAPRTENRDDGLQEFGQAVDDAKSQILAQLDLHHFSGELFAHQANFFRRELHLPSALLDQMIDKQGGQELRFFIAGVAAEIKNL
ncbi:hypothetical protein [Nitrospira sp. BLG_1]|uniref:hypothetical protein n=1 Tax=Nitrospira sp. BLG_1 TaxID=3395883 RepID=UPI0039BC3390